MIFALRVAKMVAQLWLVALAGFAFAGGCPITIPPFVIGRWQPYFSLNLSAWGGVVQRYDYFVCSALRNPSI